MQAHIEELGGGVLGETRARMAGRVLDSSKVRVSQNKLIEN